MAEEQGLPFEEVLSIILGEYVAGLPEEQQALARLLEQQQRAQL